MKALQFDRFGSPDVIVLRDVPQPVPGPGQIRIAVRACGLTPADWHVVDGLLADHLPPLPRGLGLEVEAPSTRSARASTASRSATACSARPPSTARRPVPPSTR